jgi:hypothetical protein
MNSPGTIGAIGAIGTLAVGDLKPCNGAVEPLEPWNLGTSEPFNQSSIIVYNNNNKNFNLYC